MRTSLLAWCRPHMEAKNWVPNGPWKKEIPGLLKFEPKKAGISIANLGQFGVVCTPNSKISLWIVGQKLEFGRILVLNATHRKRYKPGFSNNVMHEFQFCFCFFLCLQLIHIYAAGTYVQTFELYIPAIFAIASDISLIPLPPFALGAVPRNSDPLFLSSLVPFHLITHNSYSKFVTSIGSSVFVLLPFAEVARNRLKDVVPSQRNRSIRERSNLDIDGGIRGIPGRKSGVTV